MTLVQTISNPTTTWLQVWAHCLPEAAQPLLQQHIPVSYILDLHPNQDKIETVQQRLLSHLTSIDNDRITWAPFGNLNDCIVAFWYNHATSVGMQEVPKPNKGVVADEQHITKTMVQTALWNDAPRNFSRNRKTENVHYGIIALSGWLFRPAANTSDMLQHGIMAQAAIYLNNIEMP